MRFAIFIFISSSLALLIPRCGTGGSALSSVQARDVDPSPVAADQAVAESRYPYTKKIKTSSKSTISHSTTSLATRVGSTAVSIPLATSTSTCMPHSICVDKISPCGKRYGGCYDENYCDRNSSPFPIPACPTMVTKKRAAAEPAITPA